MKRFVFAIVATLLLTACGASRSVLKMSSNKEWEKIKPQRKEWGEF